MNWRERLPVLQTRSVLLRELDLSDAPSLLHHVCREQVLRYIAQSPTSVEGFERFIRWSHVQRRRRSNICYGVVPARETAAVGLLQIWPIEPDFSTAEWGFVIGADYWVKGVFSRAAHLFLDFAFDTLGVLRLESRAVDANTFGAAALTRLGARSEGRLRQAFRQGDVLRDYVLWAILADEWAEARARSRGAN